jgi:putative ribosome biogenesis GTPase RsgA
MSFNQIEKSAVGQVDNEVEQMNSDQLDHDANKRKTKKRKQKQIVSDDPKARTQTLLGNFIKKMSNEKSKLKKLKTLI